MINEINWISISFAILGSGITALSMFGAAFVAWGRITQSVQVHGLNQRKHDNELLLQIKRAGELKAEIESIKTRCATRESLCHKNNEEHVELFSRIHILETSLAALPGRSAEMIDKKFVKWRDYLKDDIRSVLYELEREKRQCYWVAEGREKNHTGNS